MAMLPLTLYKYFIIKSEIQVCVSSNYEEKISILHRKHAGTAGNQRYKKVKQTDLVLSPQELRDNSN